MNEVLEWLFWGGGVLVFWGYVGYPLGLLLMSLLPERNKPEVSEALPSVALLISCFNEQAVIEDKLENALELDYPAELLDIVVISDASDDDTDEIVRRYESRGVRLVRQDERHGKTAGINRAMETVTAEVVVFSDANALYAPDALRMLVRNFASPEIGFVVGAALYVDEDETAAAMTENLYWRLEIATKRMESRLHSVVGGDGAIYAIRRDLYQPLDKEDINDFVNPLQIVVAGYRGRFEPAARCYEKTAGSFGGEARRKQRIVNRSIRGLFRIKGAMNPFRTGWFAIQVVSHKLLRWLAPFILLLMSFCAAWLAIAGVTLFAWISIAAAAFLVLALAAHLLGSSRIPAVIALPYYFFLTNFYSARGVWEYMRGRTQVTWSTSRPGTEPRMPRSVGVVLIALLVVLLVSGALGLVR